LKSPRDLARLRAQRDDRVRPSVVARALTAEIVGTRTAGWNEDEVTLGVDGHDGPRVRRARLRRDRGWPRIPGPSLRARPHGERADDAGWHAGAAVVVDRGPDDDDVVDDRRRRRH